jgi:predicted membrane channel-forming protein YqfA (hemolysin III family)
VLWSLSTLERACDASVLVDHGKIAPANSWKRQMTMRSQSTFSTLHRRAAAWASVAVLLLLMPLLAMQVTDQVDWGVFDFVAAALLIGSAAFAWELALRMTAHRIWRRAIALALAASFLLL